MEIFTIGFWVCMACGLACFYDDEKPFIHIEALDTFEFLKAQVGTGYYEELIRKYLLENTHGAIVLIKPEKF